MDKVRLGDIATLITKGTTPTSVGFEFVDDGINFVKIESIDDDGTFLPSKFAHINAECNEKLKRSQLQENDILFSIAGAIGRTAIVTKDILPANTNQALAIIRIPNVVVDYKYLIYALESDSTIEQANKNKQGVAQLNLSLQNINDFVIPLFTEEKQKEIVSSLSLLDDLISARKEQLSKLDELVKSRFIEMFGDLMKNPYGWPVKKISDISLLLKSGLSRKLLNEDIGLPMIRSCNIQDGQFIYDDIKYWYVDDPQGANTEDYILDDGDVLINFINSISQIGKTAIFTDVGRKCIYTTNIFRMKLASDCNKYFYNWYAMTEYYKRQLQNIIQPAVNQASFTTVKFLNLNIPLPPMELQEQFAIFVEHTDKLKSEIKESLEKLETLKKSLMQEYFG